MTEAAASSCSTATTVTNTSAGAAASAASARIPDPGARTPVSSASAGPIVARVLRSRPGGLLRRRLLVPHGDLCASTRRVTTTSWAGRVDDQSGRANAHRRRWRMRWDLASVRTCRACPIGGAARSWAAVIVSADPVDVDELRARCVTDCWRKGDRRFVDAHRPRSPDVQWEARSARAAELFDD
jgi:hypothetical protein